MLTDEAIIKVTAGDGGDGAVSFRREKYVPKGGPDGGDGGGGGDVYFVCKNDVQTLSNYARKKEWKAQSGENGRPKRQTGKDGEDLELVVPPGTILKTQNSKLKSQNDGSNINQENSEVLHDFTKEGDRFLVVKGGRGGWGNVHFATAVHQTPLIAKKGTKGEEKYLTLELKLIADVGIIGLPNSGKSTLLAKISNARPKIADYPFTTLEPNLGVVSFHNKEIVFADIPGLITGASEGKGLGDKFLRHIERTKELIHLIDINSSSLVEDYRIIRKELEQWSENLLRKEEIIVLNKIDTMLSKDSKKVAKEFSKKIGKNVVLISAVSRQGINELLDKLG